ncbi:MAG: hypothetical protein R6U63_01115 [Longimicrobiales bacterium]
MSPTLPALALAGLLAPGGPAYGGTQAATPSDTLVGPGSAVPYVAQGPLLCGGASAAMVERFWGALGVYADDYAPLVDRSAGGIHTDDLADALAERGHRVEVLRGEPTTALARVQDGVPVVALLQSGRSRFHYVVVVAAGPDAIRFHDPLVAPGRRLSRQDFLDRWAPSDHWALVAVPARAPDDAAARPEPDAGPERDAGADPAADPDPARSLPPPLEAGLAALRAGRPDTAVAAAERYLRTASDDDPHLAIAREMLATARYLAGDEVGALRAWNLEGGPPVDLVRVRGLETLRYRTVADPMGIRARDRLTPERLRLARRRVGQLPSVARARVDYRPLRDGSVEVRAEILERRQLPRPVDLAVSGLAALVNARAEVAFGPVLTVGERWRLRGAWEGARPLAEAVVAVPWPPLAAVVTVRAGWTEERYAPADGAIGADTTRRWGVATLRRWMSPGTRLGLSLGVERWEGRGRLGRVGVSALHAFPGDRVRVGAAVDAWPDGPGEAPEAFGRARLAGRARYETAPGRAWSVTGGGTLVSRGAPPTVWDGAGTGRARAPLLRGHPLIRNDRMGRDAFGRGLLHGSLGHAWFVDAGPARAALELFVDGARVWDPLVGDAPRSYVDPGVELRFSDGESAAAVSLARGGSRWVLSARIGSPSGALAPLP